MRWEAIGRGQRHCWASIRIPATKGISKGDRRAFDRLSAFFSSSHLAQRLLLEYKSVHSRRTGRLDKFMSMAMFGSDFLTDCDEGSMRSQQQLAIDNTRGCAGCAVLLSKSYFPPKTMSAQPCHVLYRAAYPSSFFIITRNIESEHRFS